MKGRFWKRIFLASLVLAAAAGARAQSQNASKSVTIKIVAYVPPVLNLSLDFSRDSTAQLFGYVPDDNARESGTEPSRNHKDEFEIRRGATIDLGNAQLFSNLISTYSVNVYSANGGSLRNPAEASRESIPYQLRFGDSLASAVGGIFKFTAGGKSSFSSASHRVALEIGDVPPSAINGYFTDQLMFAVSAN
jgi:hypothetical protein